VGGNGTGGGHGDGSSLKVKTGEKGKAGKGGSGWPSLARREAASLKGNKISLGDPNGRVDPKLGLQNRKRFLKLTSFLEITSSSTGAPGGKMHQ